MRELGILCISYLLMHITTHSGLKQAFWLSSQFCGSAGQFWSRLAHLISSRGFVETETGWSGMAHSACLLVVRLVLIEPQLEPLIFATCFHVMLMVCPHGRLEFSGEDKPQ